MSDGQLFKFEAVLVKSERERNTLQLPRDTERFILLDRRIEKLYAWLVKQGIYEAENLVERNSNRRKEVS